jgi:hypothetical protein
VNTGVKAPRNNKAFRPRTNTDSIFVYSSTGSIWNRTWERAACQAIHS